MKKENQKKLLLTETAEFEVQLMNVMKAAHKGDEKSLEIIMKLKQAISSF
ncbi:MULTISPECIES: hypothetical protein [Bacillus cereus group]|nr:MULTISPECIES: hypothetical protein [Bacillus cereus group]MED3480107.1 hypothetical protein [Bacillus thuringiensis]MED3635104.1 hypothetical protein [Bacillus thuringiensis]HDR6268869.1 hypothetical protein [Bacillus cereus]